MEKFGTLDSSGKTIVILLIVDRRWPHTVKEEGDNINKTFFFFNVKYARNVRAHMLSHVVTCCHMLEVSLLGARTVLRLERDAWSMAK